MTKEPTRVDRAIEYVFTHYGDLMRRLGDDTNTGQPNLEDYRKLQARLAAAEKVVEWVDKQDRDRNIDYRPQLRSALRNHQALVAKQEKG